MMKLAAKTKGFDPKPFKNAGLGPLWCHFATVHPLRFKYTYDIYRFRVLGFGFRVGLGFRV
jgi:hypothetical protein